MAPTEATILSTFLLPPATLPAIITLKAFTELFPRTQQSSPSIRKLYRDLQHQRARLTDAVTHNIAAEVKRGNAQRLAVLRESKRVESGDHDNEADVENTLFGSTSNLPVTTQHNLTSVIPELQIAAEALDDEVQRLEEEAAQHAAEMWKVVGGLSDLRYGCLSDEKLRQQVLQSLDRLEHACDKT